MSPDYSGKDVAEMSHLEDQRERLSMDKMEAAKLGPESNITWTPEEERVALKKLDWNLIPL